MTAEQLCRVETPDGVEIAARADGQGLPPVFLPAASRLLRASRLRIPNRG